MLHSRAERLSMLAPLSAPFTLKLALARSDPRPISTAETVVGAPAGAVEFGLGARVRTMGGAATADGEAIGDGLSVKPGEGVGSTRKRRASLGWRVGGTPEVASAASLPGAAPCAGRSMAGRQPATSISIAPHTAQPRRRPLASISRESTLMCRGPLQHKSITADDARR